MLRWNDEMQNIFSWNVNMIRVVMKLTDTMDVRVGFTKYPTLPSVRVHTNHIVGSHIQKSNVVLHLTFHFCIISIFQT